MANVHNDEKLSVVIPAYNAQHRIERCIKSVLKAMREQDELIIVNDGSTDHTADIVKMNSDRRIRLVEQVNSGVSAARNNGIENASGDLIAFVDADDMVQPDAFELLRGDFATQVDVRISGYQMVNEEGTVLYSNKHQFEKLDCKKVRANEIAENYFSFFYAGMLNSCCSKMYRKAAIGQTRFNLMLKMGEDASFNLRVFENCRCIEFVSGDPYLYFQDEKQSTKKLNPEMGKMLCTHFSDIDTFICEFGGYNNKTVCEGMGKCWGNTICDYIYDYCDNPDAKSQIQSMLRMQWSRYLRYAKELPLKKRCILWAISHNMVDVVLRGISAAKQLKN